MLIILSPSKRQLLVNELARGIFSLPEFQEEAKILTRVLQAYSLKELEMVLQVSPDLAGQSFLNLRSWHLPFTPSNARQAILLFDGDVYDGLDAVTLSDETLNWSQHHLRILSALYGILKPLDLIQSYRLEMAHDLKAGKHKNLYDFWKDKITTALNHAIRMSGSQILVNLASAEYFRAIDKRLLEGTIITPEFRDFRNGSYKMVSYYAKRARGLMARFILENRITEADDLEAFSGEGYFFNPRLSDRDRKLFTRGG